jgi:hypothetical protein
MTGLSSMSCSSIDWICTLSRKNVTCASSSYSSPARNVVHFPSGIVTILSQELIISRNSFLDISAIYAPTDVLIVVFFIIVLVYE